MEEREKKALDSSRFPLENVCSLGMWSPRWADRESSREKCSRPRRRSSTTDPVVQSLAAKKKEKKSQSQPKRGWCEEDC